LFQTKSTGVAAVFAAAFVAVVPPAAAGSAAASAQNESPLERDDVAVISLADGAMRLGAGDGVDPESLVYTTGLSPRGVEVGWDTSEIGAGEVFGDAVTLRLRAVDGPAEFHMEPLRLPVGDQGATTWTFPAPGQYTLTFAVEANLLTGEPVSTQARYTVAVEPAQVDALPAGTPSTPPPSPTVASAPEARALPAAPLAAVQPAPTTPGRVVLAEGHVDAVAPRLLDGKLQIHVKDGVTVGQAGGQVRWREPGDVTFHVKPVAKAALPDDTKLAFLGRPGAEIFLLPQQQQPGILWTGWSTEELHADQVTGPITWRLTKVDGPGAFGIFTTGSFGDSTVIFNSTDGLPDSHSVALGTHAHANWGFAKPGTYRLTFDTTAKLTGGQTVSDSEVYTFAVGDVDPNSATPGGGRNGGGDGAGADGGDRTPGLADTGATGVLPLAAGGLVLLGVGGVAVVVGRRKRENR
jgi:surface-anchored protein/LPXTG-motif cell wall-anchored protein